MAANISFHHDKWPFELNDAICIFNSKEYIESTIEEKSALRKFTMLKDNNVMISLIYSIKKDEVIIGESASFGFPEIVKDISFKRIQFFMDEFFKQLLKEKVRLIRWMHYPELYNTEYNPLIVQSLLNLGFIMEASFLNHHLSTEDSFETRLKDDTRRRLNKINRSEILTEFHEKFDTSLFYDKLIDWRNKKGIPVNIRKEVMDTLIKRMASKYVLFTAKKDAKLIALAIGAKVIDSVLYYFIPASDPNHDDLSPAIAIIQKMKEYAMENGIKYLDLGISSAMNEEENYGLIQFKEKIGGRAGIKYSFIKEIR